MVIYSLFSTKQYGSFQFGSVQLGAVDTLAAGYSGLYPKWRLVKLGHHGLLFKGKIRSCWQWKHKTMRTTPTWTAWLKRSRSHMCKNVTTFVHFCPRFSSHICCILSYKFPRQDCDGFTDGEGLKGIPDNSGATVKTSQCSINKQPLTYFT